MKKTLIIGIITAAVLSLLYFAAAGLTDSYDNSIRVSEVELKSVSDKFKDKNDKNVDELALFFAKNVFYDDEQEYIISLYNEGYDLGRLMKVSEFWLDTDEEKELIKDILDELPEDKEKIEDSDIEEAFNDLTSEKGGALTYDEAKMYIEKGLSLKELYIANTLSRKGVYKIEKILDKKIEDGSFNKTMKEIYTKSNRDKISFDDISEEEFLKIESPDEIIISVRLSRGIGEKAGAILKNNKKPSEKFGEFVEQRKKKIKAQITGNNQNKEGINA